MGIKKKFIDTNLKNKLKTVEEKLQFINFEGSQLPLPTEIEISESGTCNRKCSFCPRSAKDFVDKKEFIKSDLHEKLCSELKNYDYAGTIRYSGFVEPLLDKNIYNLIKMAKDYLPKCNIELVTNGDPLNLERLKKLFLHGLNKILISAYDGNKEAIELENLCKEAKLNNNQYIVRHRYLTESEDFGITLSNRGGMLENAEYVIAPRKEKLKKKCFYPSYKFFLDYNGDVLMCSHDWGKKNILGNLKNENFLDIWLSEKFNLARQKLNNADRSLNPCNVCDVKGDLIGKKHHEAWKNL